jgi:uncharacterized protein (DUF433 family)
MMTIQTETKPRAPIERTEHPHIVKSADTLGGEPRIEETRISVLLVFDMFEGGTPIDEIRAAYPDLSLAQIYDAISYGHDHPDERHFHRERHKLRNIMRDHDMVLVNSFLIARSRLKPSDIPEGATVYTWETLPRQEDE